MYIKYYKFFENYNILVKIILFISICIMEKNKSEWILINAFYYTFWMRKSDYLKYKI